MPPFPLKRSMLHKAGSFGNRILAVKRVRRMACALALALTFGLCGVLLAPAPEAFADVRKSDRLVGTTVESRGITSALCPNVEANYAILVDGNGKVYFERDPDERVQIASITKVMTAIVAMDGFPLDTPIVVNGEAAAVGESSAGLQKGDTMTLEAALNGLLVSSGNDAAIAISNTLGASLKTQEGQSNTAAFVAAMNAKAQELGMTNSLFANAHGLDYDTYAAEMYSSARDVATMCSYAMKNELFRNIVSQDAAVIEVTRLDGEVAEVELESTDMLIGVYEGACGIKTGFTKLAGSCFAGACEREGEYLYAILLDSSSNEQRFWDAEALYDWVYDNRVVYHFARSSETAVLMDGDFGTEVPVVAEVQHAEWKDRRVKATLSDPGASTEVFTLEGNVSQNVVFNELKGDIAVGDVVGTVTFYQRNEPLATFDLISLEAMKGPTGLDSFKMWWQSIWGDEVPTLESVVINETPLIYSKDVTAAA